MIVKKITMFFVIMMAATISAAPAVTDVTAKQRYPWNGLVDITCTVSGISGTVNEFIVAAVNSGNVHYISRFWVVKNGINYVDHSVHTNGTYHLVWDSTADFDRQICSNMVMRVNIRSGVQLWENGPSWATTNIGADNSEDYGYYFWWGDTVGYKRENDKWVASNGWPMGSLTESIVPTYNMSIPTLQSQGWITADHVFVPAHDAAHVHWGGAWRMPTWQELGALNSNCDWTWTTRNGVNGYVVRGRGKYATDSIFLPCAGYGYGTSLYDAGSEGLYWSSVPRSESNRSAWAFYIRSSYHGRDGNYRYFGQSIRPVQDIIYMVTYSPGVNGSGEQQTITKTHGVVLMLKGATYTRDGYTQTGWATSEGGVKAYDLGASYTANVAVTLYPFWTVNSSVDQHDKVQLWADGPYWATTNIGADNPEDSGYYFWWGDTVGYKRENDKWVASDGSSSDYSFASTSTPTYGKSIDTLQSEGWIRANGVLVSEHDAAHVHWGGTWRMPTKQELDALQSNCDWTWMTMNGVNGYIVKGKGMYASASIFLPCVGFGYGTSLYNAGSQSYYWSSVPYSNPYSDSDPFWESYRYSWYFYFRSDKLATGYGDYYRVSGQPVRPVQEFTN